MSTASALSSTTRRWRAVGVVAVLAMFGLAWRVAAPSSPKAKAQPETHWAKRADTPERRAFERGLDSLVSALIRLDSALTGGSPAEARPAYRAARRAYKRVEALVEFYAPATAGTLNGPLPEDDGDAPARPLGAPATFQVVEAALFSPADPNDMASARRAAGSMRQMVARLRSQTSFLSITAASAADAARLELARVTTLGLTGFDTVEPDSVVAEAADALDGLKATLGASAPRAEIDATFTRAIAYLRAHPDFGSFNRLLFITAYSTPAARAVAAMRAAAGPPEAPHRRAWRAEAATVFDSGAFDASAFAPEYAPASTPALVALGERLFAEPRLSGTGARSCASCHVPTLGFTDHHARAITLDPRQQAAARNTPTLLNAAYQPRLFYDERAGSLEEQVGMVLANPSEMGSSAELVAERLRGDSSYRAVFARTLAGRPDSAVTEMAVRVALAAYVRSLTSLNSRFDRALRGDTMALSASERAGFAVFAGKGRCATCHFLPLLNGTPAPHFATSEVEIIGAPSAPAAHGGRVDPDLGRAAVDRVVEHEHAFKVPTLRNVALTAPYMHNGAFATLEQVVDFYDRGGGAGVGARVRGQTLSPRPLHLSDAERAQLVAFLGALTDSATATHRHDP